MTRESVDHLNDISKDTHVKHHGATDVPFSQLDELSTLLRGCAAEVCVISPAGTNFAISRGT